ncbi:MAG: DUF5076 domain-containing protein, partial [Sphingomonas sp.]
QPSGRGSSPSRPRTSVQLPFLDGFDLAELLAHLLEDPTVFGYLMADTIRHAARAYAGTWAIGEDAALQAIVDGLGRQLREQFGEIETIQEGKLN